MRFLVDANLSPVVAARLTERGHDAAHVVDVGLLTASDQEILARADADERVLVSFADYSRNCIWTIFRGDNGLPDPATRAGFVTGAAGPVNLEIGPGGDLFYVDFGGGTIRRIRFVGEDPPLTCPTGEFKADYYSNATLAGSPAFSRCEAAIANNWGSGGPGGGLGTDNFSVRWSGRHPFAAGEHTFTARADDGIRVRYDGGLIIDAWRDQAPTTYVATAVAPAAGEREVVVEYYEKTGGAVAEVSWRAGNDPPVPVIDSPGAGTGWTVGERITFSGRATDAEDGTLPPSSLSWSLVLQHCPSTCHAHPLQTYPGVAGSAFDTPDHDYPSHLELRLTATDSAGASSTVTRRLDPGTVGLAFATDPPGLGLTVGGTTQAAPFTRTVIVGSANTVSAPTPQTVGGTTYDFVAWSDGGSATHTVVAGATGTTTTATYRRARRPGSPSPGSTSSPPPPPGPPTTSSTPATRSAPAAAGGATAGTPTSAGTWSTATPAARRTSATTRSRGCRHRTRTGCGRWPCRTGSTASEWSRATPPTPATRPASPWRGPWPSAAKPRRRGGGSTAPSRSRWPTVA